MTAKLCVKKTICPPYIYLMTYLFVLTFEKQLVCQVTAIHTLPSVAGITRIQDCNNRSNIYDILVLLDWLHPKNRSFSMKYSIQGFFLSCTLSLNTKLDFQNYPWNLWAWHESTIFLLHFAENRKIFCWEIFEKFTF